MNKYHLPRFSISASASETPLRERRGKLFRRILAPIYNQAKPKKPKIEWRSAAIPANAIAQQIKKRPIIVAAILCTQEGLGDPFHKKASTARLLASGPGHIVLRCLFFRSSISLRCPRIVPCCLISLIYRLFTQVANDCM